MYLYSQLTSSSGAVLISAQHSESKKNMSICDDLSNISSESKSILTNQRIATKRIYLVKMVRSKVSNALPTSFSLYVCSSEQFLFLSGVQSSFHTAASVPAKRQNMNESSQPCTNLSSGKQSRSSVELSLCPQRNSTQKSKMQILI